MTLLINASGLWDKWDPNQRERYIHIMRPMTYASSAAVLAMMTAQVTPIFSLTLVTL